MHVWQHVFSIGKIKRLEGLKTKPAGWDSFSVELKDSDWNVYSLIQESSKRKL